MTAAMVMAGKVNIKVSTRGSNRTERMALFVADFALLPAFGLFDVSVGVAFFI
jgi:hypothetical protein